MLQQERDRQTKIKKFLKMCPPAWHVLAGKDDKLNFLCGLMSKLMTLLDLLDLQKIKIESYKL